MKTLLTIMAFQYLGTPYKWGGNNYLGLDCSGLVLKTLFDVGIVLPDMSANDLYQYCQKNGTTSSKECDSLLFFGKEKATHVAISLGEIDGKWFMIEAGGSGSESLTLDKDQLANKDARVRIKPVSARKDLIASIYLPYKNAMMH